MDSFEQEMLISSWTRESAKRELRRARALCREVQTEAMSVSRGSPKVTERGEVGDSKSDVPDESRADLGTGEQTASAAIYNQSDVQARLEHDPDTRFFFFNFFLFN